MSRAVMIELEVPETLQSLRLPAGVNERLATPYSARVVVKD